MPLTSKGSEIKSAMQKEYGEKKGEQVFYASRNKGTITGVDASEEKEMLQELIGMEKKEAEERKAGDAAISVGETIPATVSLAQINERNRALWEQPGGQTFPNE